MTSRLSLSEARGRFPSRRGRPDWSEPTRALKPVLGQYATEKNPGLASDEQMRAVADRLNEPVASEKPPQELDSGDGSLRGYTSIRSWASNSERNPSSSLSPEAQQLSGIHSRLAELPEYQEAYELADTSVSVRSPHHDEDPHEGSDMYGAG